MDGSGCVLDDRFLCYVGEDQFEWVAHSAIFLAFGFKSTAVGLVHRGVRHCRFERCEGTAGGAVLTAEVVASHPTLRLDHDDVHSFHSLRPTSA